MLPYYVATVVLGLMFFMARDMFARGGHAEGIPASGRCGRGDWRVDTGHAYGVGTFVDELGDSWEWTIQPVVDAGRDVKFWRASAVHRPTLSQARPPVVATLPTLDDACAWVEKLFGGRA